MGVNWKREIKLGLPRPSLPFRRRATDSAALPSLGLPLMRPVNLLPKESSSRPSAGRPTPAQLVLVAGTLVVFAMLLSVYVVTSAQVTDRRLARDDLRAQLAVLAPPAAEPGQEGSDPRLVEEQAARTGALATALGQRIAWDRLLRDLSLILPEQVWLTSLVAKAPPLSEGAASPQGPSSFTVNGYTYEQEDVALLLTRLELLPSLASVRLITSMGAELGGREVVQFTIEATVRSGSSV